MNSVDWSTKATTLVAKNKLANSLIDLDHQFRQEAESYRESQPTKIIRSGATPLLISAPHATPHTRKGVIKAVDHITGALAMALGQSLKATAILPVAPQPDDPNFDTNEDAPYKKKLGEMIGDYRLLIDLHGMQDHWGDDICVGTGRSTLTTQLQQLIDTLKSNCTRSGLTMVIDHPFASCDPGTVSSFARKHGCEALQLELAAHDRQTRGIAEAFLVIRDSLAQWLNQTTQNSCNIESSS